MIRLLREVGEALYGPRWQTDLARDLGVADRTVRRWEVGDSDIPPGLAADLLRLVIARGETLDALVVRLRALEGGRSAPEPKPDRSLTIGGQGSLDADRASLTAALDAIVAGLTASGWSRADVLATVRAWAERG